VLTAERPRVVGLSTYTENMPAALLIAAQVKQHDSGIKVVLGGSHVSYTDPRRLPADAVDAVVRGEAEVSLVHLVRRWLEGVGPGAGSGGGGSGGGGSGSGGSGTGVSGTRPIPGVTYRGDDGRLLVGARVADPVDPASLPVPARDLLPMAAYRAGGCLLTARGCGRSCIFCVSWRGGGSPLRARPLDHVMAELRLLVTGAGFARLHFWDESFTADRARTLCLCRRLRDEGPACSWSAGTRVDLVDAGLLAEMAAAGCVALNFGVESGDPGVLRRIGKHIALDQVGRSVAMAAQCGIYTTYNFMMPFPDDTPATIRRTLDFALRLLDMGAGGVSFNISTPFPGTALYERAARFGLTLHDAGWEDYHYWNPVFSTRHLGRDAIRELFFEATLAVAGRRASNAPGPRCGSHAGQGSGDHAAGCPSLGVE
jgi:radical SAM superfamily enzyme YgiQ (UPF0313 family)